jgi:hypothetical protein
MARTAQLEKSAASTTGRVAPSVEREIAYHGDVAGHRRILEALGAVPELSAGLPGVGAADERADKWPPLKTLFFVLVFCSTAWATLSAAIIYAFN